MLKSVEVQIMGQKFVVRSESSEEYVKQVATYVNDKINEILGKTKSVASLNVALLTAMNIADEFLKFKEKQANKHEGMSKRIEQMIELIDLHV